MEINPFRVAEKIAIEAGYQYEKINDQVWRFLFTGRHLSEIDVVAVWQGQLFVLGAVITPNPLTPNSGSQVAQIMEQMLILNDRLDYVKIGFNREQRIAVRADLSTRTLDAQELRQLIDQVAASADFVYGAIKSFLHDGGAEVSKNAAPIGGGGTNSGGDKNTLTQTARA